MALVAKKGVRDFYRNKNILITGATGFLGTALLEKLLRSFPQINKIYVIARGKSGGGLEERSKDYFRKRVFTNLKSIDPKSPSKIVWIEGDLLKKRWGLSLEAENAIKTDVNVVFHCAASINFAEPLRNILEKNLMGTHELLDICKGIKGLKSFLYVSSIYSNVRDSQMSIGEQLYPPNVPPKEMLQILENSGAVELQLRHKSLVQDWSNLYTFSKNLAENLVDGYGKEFPVGIIRPGIIMSSMFEPFPFWMQGNIAFERVLREVAKGLLYTHNPQVVTTCVPVDLVANAMIAAAYEISHSENETRVYNFSTHSNPISFKDITEHYVQDVNRKTLVAKRFYYNFIVPVLKYLSEKTSFEFSDVRAIEKYQLFDKLIQYYLENDLVFDNTNSVKLWESLNDEERSLLFFNVDNVDWRNYYEQMMRYKVIETNY